MQPSSRSLVWPILLIGAAAIPSDPEKAARCSMDVGVNWHREHPLRTGVIVRAESDSAMAGRYVRGPDGVELSGGDESSGVAVYGQVASIVTRYPFLETPSSPQRVIIVWWGIDASCSRWYPESALGADAGEELFLGLTPRKTRVRGLPVYDIDVVSDTPPIVYTPSRELTGMRSDRARASVRMLTAREFAQVFSILPTSSAVERNSERARSQLLQWAAANRALAAGYPVSAMIDRAAPRR